VVTLLNLPAIRSAPLLDVFRQLDYLRDETRCGW